MGYWNGIRDGGSLRVEETGIVWGDEPADAVDAMLRAVTTAFLADLGRYPTAGEIRAGLEFALGRVPDDTKVER